MLHPELWETTPIVRGQNEITRMIEGNDDGYTRMSTLLTNHSPLVAPLVLLRSAYDGVSIYTGDLDVSKKMPGGLEGGKILVRETFARDLDDADKLLQTIFSGKYRLCVVDGFRSGQRQRLGFNGILQYLMSRQGFNVADVDRRVADFISLGKAAHGTFCYLQGNLASPQATALMSELRQDAAFMTEVEEYAKRSGKTADEALGLYVTISANSNLGRAADRGVPLLFECNAHAGGGAADVFLMGPDGLPINPVPFDYPGPEARMDFMEQDENYEKYVAAATQNALLRQHLACLGTTPETYTRSHWAKQRAALRVWYHLVKAKEWTYYSEEDCGENWHLEGQNKCKNVLTGQVFYAERLTAGRYPGSGNPGHTLQVLGKDAIAVWGGGTAHQLLANQILA